MTQTRPSQRPPTPARLVAGLASTIAALALAAPGGASPAASRGTSSADAPGAAAAGMVASEHAGFLPRLLQKLQGDREEMRRWSYVESTVLEKRDTDGEVRSRTTEVYEVFPRDGRRMKRPLSLDLDQDSQGFAIVRREESRFLPGGPGSASGARAVKENPFEIESLVRCYQFDSRGLQSLAGRAALRVAFTPIDGCLDDGSRAGRLLQDLSGTLWIDDRDSDVVKIEGRLRNTVTFGFGLLGRIEQFDLEVERQLLAPGLYTMTHFNYRARGTSFIFHHFDVRSIRDRSAFMPMPERPDPPPKAKGGPVSPGPPSSSSTAPR